MYVGGYFIENIIFIVQYILILTFSSLSTINYSFQTSALRLFIYISQYYIEILQILK